MLTNAPQLPKTRRKHGVPVPQQYRHKDTNEIVKIERIATKQLVMTTSSGVLERLGEGDLRKYYQRLGEWPDT